MASRIEAVPFSVEGSHVDRLLKELGQGVPKGPWTDEDMRAMFSVYTELVFVEGALNDEDFADCRCKLHQVVEHDVVGGKGCAATSVGFHRSIQALYAVGGPRYYCHAEPAARRNDNVLVGLILKAAGTRYAFLTEGLPNSVKRLAGTTNFHFEAFGAFFCHLGGIRHEFRMRLVRILGPKPLIVDVVRAMCVVGRCAMQRVKLIRVGNEMFHMEPDGSERVSSGGKLLVLQLLNVLRLYGGSIRIGAGPEGARGVDCWQDPGGCDGCVGEPDDGVDLKDEHAELKAFVRERGFDAKALQAVAEDLKVNADVVSPKSEWYSRGEVDYGFPVSLYRWSDDSFPGCDFAEAKQLKLWLEGKGFFVGDCLADLQLVMLTPGSQHGFAVGARERFKVLGLMGDALFKLWVVVRSYAVGASAAGVSKAVQSLSNKSMRVMVHSDDVLVRITQGRFAANDKWYGDFVEAVVGLVFVHCGHSFAMAMVEKLVAAVDEE